MLQTHCIQLDKKSYKYTSASMFNKTSAHAVVLILTSMLWHNKKPFADKVDSNLAGLQQK